MLPPDINESQLRVHRGADRGVRFGLTAIKNVGEGAIESLLDGAREAGRIASLTRCARISTSGWSTSASSRASSRPARSIRWPGTRRTQALPSRRCAAAVRVHRCGVRARRRACSAIANDGQAQLFGGARRGGRRRRQRRRRSVDALPEAAPLDRDRAARPSRRKRSGCYWSGHPVDRHAAPLKEFGARSTIASSPTRRRSPARATTDGGQAAASRLEPDTSSRRHHRRRAGRSRRARAIAWPCSRSRTRRAASKWSSFPEAYPAGGQPDRSGHSWCWSAASWSATMRSVADAGDGDRAARHASASGWRARSPIHLTAAGGSRCARGAGRDLSRAIAATGACRSRSKPVSAARLRVTVDVTAQIRVRRRRRSSRRSSRSSAAGSGCDEAAKTRKHETHKGRFRLWSRDGLI